MVFRTGETVLLLDMGGETGWGQGAGRIGRYWKGEAGLGRRVGLERV